MDCHDMFSCLQTALLNNIFLIGLCLVAVASFPLILPFPFKREKTKLELFLTFFAIGFTALIIGYLSTLSRETGIPTVVSAVITGFSGYMIYLFFGTEENKIDVVGSSLGIIYFMGFLLYGGVIGSHTREAYEKLDLPVKLAAQEQILKAAREERHLNEDDHYHQ
jgi:hypothetical protein